MLPNSQILPRSVAVLFVHQKLVIISPQIVCVNSASFSCTLTMAQYLCENYPDLIPPEFPMNKVQHNNYQEHQRKEMKLFFEPWCDYFNLLMEKSELHGQIAQNNGVMYLICKVNQNYFKNILNILNLSVFKLRDYGLVEQIVNFLPTKKKLKVGIINFSLAQLKEDYFTPKVNLLSLFIGIWFKHGDEWKRYDVLKGHYPTQKDIQQMDIFILSGSTMSVNDNNAHVEKVLGILRQGLNKYKNLKILGLCFGHQAFAKFYEGNVQRKQLYSGAQFINFNKELVHKFQYLKGIQNLSIPYSAQLIQFHNDYVTRIPKNFLILASSQSCQNEAMISKDGRCLSFQFHTQYTIGYCRAFELKIKKYFKNQDVMTTNYELKTQVLQKYGIDKHFESCKIIRQAIRNFIQWKAQ